MSDRTDAAFVPLADGPEEVEQVTSNETASAVTEKVGETAAQTESQEQADGEHKRLGGWQRKIQKLERTNEALLAELLKRNSVEEKKVAAEPEPVEPDPEKFETVAEYLKAVRAFDRAEVERVLAKRLEEREQKVSQKTVEQKRQESWQTKVAEFSKEHPDFDELVSDESLPITRAMAEASFDSDLGPAIAYHLASNPAEAARIAKLPESAQIREIGKIEARLELQKSPAKTEAESEEDDPKPATPVSKAPPPISPVKKTAAVEKPFDPNDGKLADSMSADEWARKRREWLAKKR